MKAGSITAGAAVPVRQALPARRRLRVQLEAPPLQLQVVLRLQPDQAALLRDEAEGSDEVGPDAQRDCHGIVT